MRPCAYHSPCLSIPVESLLVDWYRRCAPSSSPNSTSSELAVPGMRSISPITFGVSVQSEDLVGLSACSRKTLVSSPNVPPVNMSLW